MRRERNEILLIARDMSETKPLLDTSTKLYAATESHENRQWPRVFPLLQVRKKRLVARWNGQSTGMKRHLASANKMRFCCRFVRDWYTGLINSSTITVVFTFVLCHLVSWLAFAGVWLGIIEAYRTKHSLECIPGIKTYAGAFLYSVVSQTSIGYGSEHIAVSCTGGVAALMMQSIIGLMIDAVSFGVLFARITVPRKRRATILFSKKAVIYNKAKGMRVLEFRVADLRRLPLRNCSMLVQLYINKKCGEKYIFETHNLRLTKDHVFLLTPVMVTHVIDESSPLHGLTPALFQSMDLEIVAALEGSVQGTGLAGQYLWSYTQSEVLFEHKFVDVVHMRRCKWEIDYLKISETIPANFH